MSGGGGGGGGGAVVDPPTTPEPAWQGPAQQTFHPVNNQPVLEQLLRAFPQGLIDQLSQPQTYTPRGILPPVNPTNPNIWIGGGTAAPSPSSGGSSGWSSGGGTSGVRWG